MATDKEIMDNMDKYFEKTCLVLIKKGKLYWAVDQGIFGEALKMAILLDKLDKMVDAVKIGMQTPEGCLWIKEEIEAEIKKLRGNDS